MLRTNKQRNTNVHNLSGQKFGRLTVIMPSEPAKSGHWKWLCECSCGRLTTVWATNLIGKHTISCGCLKRELTAKRMKNTLTTHGQSNSNAGGPTPTYNSWIAMKRRCLNPNAPNYYYYGGRGIEIEPTWINSFENFLAYMGERPSNTTLERINNNLGYFPGNVRWATPKEQANNRRPQRRKEICAHAA